MPKSYGKYSIVAKLSDSDPQTQRVSSFLEDISTTGNIHIALFNSIDTRTREAYNALCEILSHTVVSWDQPFTLVIFPEAWNMSDYVVGFSFDDDSDLFEIKEDIVKRIRLSPRLGLSKLDGNMRAYRPHITMSKEGHWSGWFSREVSKWKKQQPKKKRALRLKVEGIQLMRNTKKWFWYDKEFLFGQRGESDEDKLENFSHDLRESLAEL